MNQTSPIHRIYTLLKVYSCIALGAAGIALLYGLLAQIPLYIVLIILFVIVGFVVLVWLNNPKLVARLLINETGSLVLPLDIPNKKRRKKKKKKAGAVPPRFWSTLLSHVLRPEIRNFLMADLEEEYARRIRRNSSRIYAKLWYGEQVIRSIIPILVTRFKIGLLNVFRLRQ
jgi:hypothetical protein